MVVNLPADGRNVGDSLSQQMAAETARVLQAVCTVGGRLVASGTTISELAGSQSLELELLCRAPCDSGEFRNKASLCFSTTANLLMDVGAGLHVALPFLSVSNLY